MTDTTKALIRAIKEGNREDADILFRKKMIEAVKPKLEEVKKRVGKTIMKEKQE